MSERFSIKRNDTSPAIEVQCLDSDGNAVDISNSDVRLIVQEYNSSTVYLDKTMTITDGISGKAKYQWEPTDTQEAGVYTGEVEVTYQDGEIETFPNDEAENIIIKIDEDIN